MVLLEWLIILMNEGICMRFYLKYFFVFVVKLDYMLSIYVKEYFSILCNLMVVLVFVIVDVVWVL